MVDIFLQKYIEIVSKHVDDPISTLHKLSIWQYVIKARMANSKNYPFWESTFE